MTALLEALLSGLPDLEGRGTCRHYGELFTHAAEGMPAAVDQAKAICHRCPVLDRCRSDLPAVGSWGVVAGLTANERDREIRGGRVYVRTKAAVDLVGMMPASKNCPACDREVPWTTGRRAAGPWWCSEGCRRLGHRFDDAQDDAA